MGICSPQKLVFIPPQKSVFEPKCQNQQQIQRHWACRWECKELTSRTTVGMNGGGNGRGMRNTSRLTGTPVRHPSLSITWSNLKVPAIVPLLPPLLHAVTWLRRSYSSWFWLLVKVWLTLRFPNGYTPIASACSYRWLRFSFIGFSSGSGRILPIGSSRVLPL